MHTEYKVTEAEMLKIMKTDEEVEGLFALASRAKRREDGGPEEFDNALPEWGEMHMSGSRSTGWF